MLMVPRIYLNLIGRNNWCLYLSIYNAYHLLFALNAYIRVFQNCVIATRLRPATTIILQNSVIESGKSRSKRVNIFIRTREIPLNYVYLLNTIHLSKTNPHVACLV